MNSLTATTVALIANPSLLPPPSVVWERILWPSVLVPVVISALSYPLFGRKQKVLLVLGVVIPWGLYAFRCVDIATDHHRWAEYENPKSDKPDEVVAYVSPRRPAVEESRSPQPDISLTYEKYLKLKVGMSYNEVHEIIGFHGKESVRDHTAGIVTSIVDWRLYNEYLSVIFQNDALTTKSQFGLK